MACSLPIRMPLKGSVQRDYLGRHCTQDGEICRLVLGRVVGSGNFSCSETHIAIIVPIPSQRHKNTRVKDLGLMLGSWIAGS